MTTLPRGRTRYFPKIEKVVCKRYGGVPCLPGFTFPKANWNVSSPFCFSCRWQTRRQRYHIRHQHGLQWKDAPDEYGPHKPLYNRFVRWSKIGIFNKIFNKLANQTTFDGSLMLDSTHLKAHRTAAILLKKGILHVSSVVQKED